MNVLDLFSGIGGFSLGLERAGFKTVAFCEIEPYCRAVLKKHWPEIPIYEDVRKLNGKEFRGVDLICGGYPCQPFSTAGKQKGSADERHLWPEMFRIIREARPRWVIAENVRGHVRLGFDEVALQLENDGFTVWPFIIPACAVDAPHKRERVWIVAHAQGLHDRGIGGEVHGENGRPEGKLGSESGGAGETRKVVGNASGAASERNARSLPTAQAGFSGERQQNGDLLERFEYASQSCPSEWWRIEPNVGRVAHGVSRRVDRVKALGNAVVPQIPEIIGRAIMKQLNKSKMPNGEGEV